MNLNIKVEVRVDANVDWLTDERMNRRTDEKKRTDGRTDERMGKTGSLHRAMLKAGAIKTHNCMKWFISQYIKLAYNYIKLLKTTF